MGQGTSAPIDADFSDIESPIRERSRDNVEAITLDQQYDCILYIGAHGSTESNADAHMKDKQGELYDLTQLNPASNVPYDIKEKAPSIQVFQNTSEYEGNIQVHFLSLANVGTCVTIQAENLLQSLNTFMEEGGEKKTIQQLTNYLDDLRKVGFKEKEGKQKLSSQTLQVDRISSWKLCELYTNRLYSPDKNPAEIPLTVLYLKPSIQPLPTPLFQAVYDTYKDQHLSTKKYISRLELIEYLSKHHIKKPLLIDSSCGNSFKFEDRRDAKHIATFSKEKMIAGKTKRKRKKSKRK